jgi:hypothetical protein
VGTALAGIALLAVATLMRTVTGMQHGEDKTMESLDSIILPVQRLRHELRVADDIQFIDTNTFQIRYRSFDKSTGTLSYQFRRYGVSDTSCITNPGSGLCKVLVDGAKFSSEKDFDQISDSDYKKVYEVEGLRAVHWCVANSTPTAAANPVSCPDDPGLPTTLASKRFLASFRYLSYPSANSKDERVHDITIAVELENASPSSSVKKLGSAVD